MDEETGPEVDDVISWLYHAATVSDGTRQPPQSIAGGPKVMMVVCSRCNKGPWRVTKGRDTLKETFFYPFGISVRICCETCGQNRSYLVADLPGYVESHT